MACNSCNDPTPKNIPNCTPLTATVCQPLPFPVEPETVELSDCYAGNCDNTVTLQEFSDKVTSDICKLNLNQLQDCTIPTVHNNEYIYKPILEAIADCHPAPVGTVLTRTSSGVAFVNPFSCTTFSNQLATCIPNSSTPTTRALTLQNGVPVYAPIKQVDCPVFLDLLATCPGTSATPVTQALTLQNGVPVYAPIKQVDCPVFLDLLATCPDTSTTPATQTLTIQNGIPVYAPLPTTAARTCADFLGELETCVPDAPNPCSRPDKLLGSNTDGEYWFEQNLYELTVAFEGSSGQQLMGFNILNDLLFPTVVSESNKCSTSSWYNPATGRITIARDGIYDIGLNFYTRSRVTTSGAFTGTPQYSNYGALVVIRTASTVPIKGVMVPALTASYRVNEMTHIADNQVNNKTFTGNWRLVLPAGSQLLARYVIVNQPTGALTLTSSDLLATGNNSGQNAYLRVLESF